MTASARGLFRATGATAKPQAVRLIDGTYTKVDTVEREVDDFYPTPPEPTAALLDCEFWRLKDFETIWEPACGDGAMARQIAGAGYGCLATDLIDRGFGTPGVNFLETKEALAPAIITNPPYHLCNERDGKGIWMWHALETLGIEYMALLLSWNWPVAGGHARLWQTYQPARAYLMRWKIDFTGQGAPPMLNGWFVWDRAHTGPCQLLMMDRTDVRQGGLI